MIVGITTTATGIETTNSATISWEQEFDSPVSGGNTLLVFVGGIDSQTPQPLTATMSGSGVSPREVVPLTTAVSLTGPGGSSFPCAWLFTLDSPMPAAGTVTGTIDITFDEPVGRMNGMSAVLTGTAGGGLVGAPNSIAQHTQLPDFIISGTETNIPGGSIVVDMCMSESSNRNTHLVGINQNKFGNVFFTGPTYSTSFKEILVTGDVEMTRTGVGGPFAGVSLTTVVFSG
jgi:hypothetical protein